MTPVPAPEQMPTAVPAPVSGQALCRARDYFVARQCRSGGFCFYRTAYLEEPNLHDTWHALAALGLLGARAPRPAAIMDFVGSEPATAQPYALYYRVRILGLLGGSDPGQAGVRVAVAALAAPVPPAGFAEDPTPGLYRLRLILWLKRSFGLVFPAQAIAHGLREVEDRDGGFGSPPNLLATRQALAVLDLCGARPSERTWGFVAGLATPDFGFRLTVDGLAPSLEVTCAGVPCCRRLVLPIHHAGGALGFILECQTGDGGFSREPGALPDIGLTHLALAALSVLAGPLSLERRRSP